MEALILNGTDRELCRVDVLDFAAKRGLDEERVIAAFLHAARVGIFELSWNVLCPGCGGVLDATATLRSIHKEAYESPSVQRAMSRHSMRWSRSPSP